MAVSTVSHEYGFSFPIFRIGKLRYAEFLKWDFSNVFEGSSQQGTTHEEVSMSPDFEIEKPFWPRVPKRRGSRVVWAVRKSSADSRVFVMWVSCGARPKSQERRSVVRIQQLASLAPIDLDHIDQGARDRDRQRLGSKLVGLAQKAAEVDHREGLEHFYRESRLSLRRSRTRRHES